MSDAAAARRHMVDGQIRTADVTTPNLIASMQAVPRELFVPAAMGPAPLGLTSTGDPRMNGPWTALGVPAISIPMPVGDALPLGLQLTAAHGGDARLLRAAVRVHQILYKSR